MSYIYIYDINSLRVNNRDVCTSIWSPLFFEQVFQATAAKPTATSRRTGIKHQRSFSSESLPFLNFTKFISRSYWKKQLQFRFVF